MRLLAYTYLTPLLSALLLASSFTTLPAFPQGSEEAAATRLMIEAERLEQSRGGEAALVEYDALVKRFPNSSLAPKALAATAMIHYEKGDLETAEKTAQQLVETYSSSGESAAGLVMQARILVSRAKSTADLEEALTLLNRVSNLYGSARFPMLPARAEAQVLAGDLLIQLDDLGTAAASFLETIEDEPRGRFRIQALLGFGRVLALRGDRDAALEAFQLAIDEGIENPDRRSQLAVEDARRRLSLLYRFWIRPATGQQPWTTSEVVKGPEWKKLRGVDATPAGDVVVADSNVGVIRISPDGQSSSSTIRNAERPFIDPRGRHYALVSDAVRHFDQPTSDMFRSNTGKAKPLDKLQAGGRGPFDEWYIADRSERGVFVFNERGRQLEVLSGALEVQDLALDERGRVFILSEKPSKVTIHDFDRGAVNVVPGSWSKPVALDVDWLGNIYVLDSADNSITVMDSTGNRIGKISASLPGSGALRGAEDIAVDFSGRVYIADSKLQTVYRLN